jgi:glycosyltransferase involved in cell wall biosynthesis
MRVAIDCRYVGVRPSGIGAYVEALVTRLPAMAPADAFELWRRTERPLSRAPNVREHAVRWDPNNLPTLLWPSRLAPLDGVDVLHLPYNLLGLGLRCATVVTLHDLMWLLTPTLCESRIHRLLYQAPFFRSGIVLALERATRIVAVSQATADAIVATHPPAAARVRVIPHGIERRFQPPFEPEVVRARATALTGGPYFLAVGQNAPYKNHAAVLEAFAGAALPHDVRLVLVQRLNARGELPRRARALGVAERVVWLDGVNDTAALELLQSAIALVQFSLEEGFGMPALEAMACGTPVLASDIPVLREVLGPAGVKVRLEPRALGTAMERLVADVEWRRDLAALGLDRAQAFDWDASARAHLEVYREAAAAG